MLRILFLILCYCNFYKLIYSNIVSIPVSLPDINGNYYEVYLDINIFDSTPTEVVVETFCKKYKLLNIYCNQLKEQGETYTKLLKEQNSLIKIPIKYADPRTGNIKQLIFEVSIDEPLKDILLSSFCIKNFIDDEACNDIMQALENKLNQVNIFSQSSSSMIKEEASIPSAAATSNSFINTESSSSRSKLSHPIYDDNDDFIRIPMNVMNPSGESNNVEIFEINKNEPLVDVIVNVFCNKHNLTSQYCELLYKNALILINIKKGYRLKPKNPILQHSSNSISIAYGMKEYPSIVTSEVNRLFMNQKDDNEHIDQLIMKESEIFQTLLLDLELVIAKRVCIIHSITLKPNHYIIIEEIMNYLVHSELMVDLDGILVFNYGYPISIEFQKKYGSVTWIQVANHNDYFEIPTLRILSKLVQHWNEKDIHTHVLYLHTLGSEYLQTYPHIDQWRQLLLYYLIEKHISSYHLLESEEIHCVGVNLIQQPSLHYHSNFWWSRSDYLTQLPELSYDNIGGRYESDLWILQLTDVRPYSIHDSNTNHYLHTYPRKCYTTQPITIVHSSSNSHKVVAVEEEELFNNQECKAMISTAIVDQNIIKALNN